MIERLDEKKAVGYDRIGAKTIKSCRQILVPALVFAINLCLETGIFPDALKIARVAPIFKSGDRKVTTNYRPVSVLPVLNKVFERAIYNRTINFLEKNKYLYKNQYGFRAKCGTQTAITEIINKIQRSLDKKNITTAVFMDLSKAFDCVQHNILIKKLDFAGI